MLKSAEKTEPSTWTCRTQWIHVREYAGAGEHRRGRGKEARARKSKTHEETRATPADEVRTPPYGLEALLTRRTTSAALEARPASSFAHPQLALRATTHASWSTLRIELGEKVGAVECRISARKLHHVGVLLLVEPAASSALCALYRNRRLDLLHFLAGLATSAGSGLS